MPGAGKCHEEARASGHAGHHELDSSGMLLTLR
jgi:hypothetical protein